MYQDILTLIPHKPPFIMVDKLTGVSEDGAQTTFLVNEKNVLVHNGLFTEAGLMENMAQTAAARAGYVALTENKPVLSGYIGAVKNLEIFNLPQTGDELITEIKIENQIFDATVVTGKVTCGNTVMATCEMKVFINK